MSINTTTIENVLANSLVGKKIRISYLKEPYATTEHIGLNSPIEIATIDTVSFLAGKKIVIWGSLESGNAVRVELTHNTRIQFVEQ